MKYFVIILLSIAGLVLSTNTCNAQRIIATTGGNYSSGEHDISWTIGESITSTIGNSDHTLTQGLHQPTLTVTGISENKNSDFAFSVYPNPVEQKLTFDMGEYANDFKIQIISNSGGIIFNESYLNDFQNISIDVNTYKQGIYYLHVLNKADAVMQSFKIVKL